MASPYCLIKPLADTFKRALKDGTINPAKLEEMTSAERRDYFAKLIGSDDAKNVNELFESKMLLKDKERAMIAWAKQVTGITPDVRRGLIERIQKMDERILNPKDEQAFLEDLAAKKLGTEVTYNEAKEITQLSQALAEAKKNIDQDPLAYGMARVHLENFIADVKRQANKLSMADFKAAPFKSTWQGVVKVGGLAKSLKSTLDFSAPGRQGFKAAFTHPKIWLNDVAKTFMDSWEVLKRKTSDETVMNALKAEIYARPNSINGLYERMKLDIGTGEEAYPSSFPEKIPVAGRLFKASEFAYNGFLTRLRADIADAYAALAEANGVNLKSSSEAQAIGSLINSLTGRGHALLGKTNDIINASLFSPKSLQSNIDFLTLNAFDKMTSFARKQAAINVLKVVGGIAGILAIAKALKPDSVELDPRSSDFGKIKIGNTRFEVMGGMSSIATLLGRLISGSSKSSSSGAITLLDGSGYNKQTRLTVLGTYFGNKLSPVASVAKDLLTGQDRNDTPPTVKGEAANLLLPLPISNAIELVKSSDSWAIKITAALADGFGIATNTYGDSTNVGQRFVTDEETAKVIHDISNAAGKPVSFTDWNSSKDPGIVAFKAQHSATDWENAKARYDYQIKDLVEQALKSDKFKSFSPEDKARYLNQLDTEARDKVFSQFGFRRPKIKKEKKLKI